MTVHHNCATTAAASANFMRTECFDTGNVLGCHAAKMGVESSTVGIWWRLNGTYNPLDMISEYVYLSVSNNGEYTPYGNFKSFE